MATFYPMSSNSDSTDTLSNTPKVRMVPEKLSASVMRPTSFTLTPVNQEKLKPSTPTTYRSPRNAGKCSSDTKKKALLYINACQI